MFEKWGLLKLSENTNPILKIHLFTSNIHFVHYWILWFRWDTLSSFVPGSGSGNALLKRHTLPLWKDTHSIFTREMYSLCVCTPFCLFIVRLNDAFTYEYKQSSFTELRKDTKHQWTQLNGSKGLWKHQHSTCPQFDCNVNMALWQYFKRSRRLIQIPLFVTFSVLFAFPAIKTYQKKEVSIGSILAQKNNIAICPDLIDGTYIVWVYNGFIVWFCNAQVITITSEKETDGFFAPSITIMAMDAEGWRGNLPFEKCQKSQN